MSIQDWRFEIQLVPSAWMHRHATAARAIDIQAGWKRSQYWAAPMILHIDKIGVRSDAFLPMTIGWSHRTTEIKLQMTAELRVRELCATFHSTARNPADFRVVADLATVFDLSAVAPEGIILAPSADALANAACRSLPVRMAGRLSGAAN